MDWNNCRKINLEKTVEIRPKTLICPDAFGNSLLATVRQHFQKIVNWCRTVARFFSLNSAVFEPFSAKNLQIIAFLWSKSHICWSLRNFSLRRHFFYVTWLIFRGWACFWYKSMAQAENLLATVRPLSATLWQHFKSVACLKATLAFQKKTSFRPGWNSPLCTLECRILQLCSHVFFFLQPAFNSVVEGAFDSGISGGWIAFSFLIERLKIFYVFFFFLLVLFKLVVPAIFNFRFAIGQPFQKCTVMVVLFAVH